MQIVLGAAQFGNKYGVANTAVLREPQVVEILDQAYQSGITQIDTAPDYGPSEVIVGRLGENRFSVGSKIPRNVEASWGVLQREKVVLSIRKSLEVLNVPQLDYVLFHSADDLRKPGIENMLTDLVQLKTLGMIRRWGASIYRAEDLLLPTHVLNQIDIVQAPLNPFDQRIVQPEALELFQKHQIAVQARSVFLQGLLLMEQTAAVYTVPHAKGALCEWHRFLDRHGGSPVELCLKFVRIHQQHLEGIVLGAAKASNVAEWLQGLSEPMNLEPEEWTSLACFDPKVVEPRLWNKP